MALQMPFRLAGRLRGNAIKKLDSNGSTPYTFISPHFAWIPSEKEPYAAGMTSYFLCSVSVNASYYLYGFVVIIPLV